MLVLAIVTLTAFTTHCVVFCAGSDDSPSSDLLDLDRLHNSLESLDFHLQNFQKRTCKLGISSHNCALEKLDEKMKAHKFLSSGKSPGKRADLQEGYPDYPNAPESAQDAHAELEEIVEQRRAIALLKRLLRAMKSESDIVHNTKKSCSLRLGGHCLTEALDRAATQYYYLKSPDSPGRRRRSVRRTNQNQNQ